MKPSSPKLLDELHEDVALVSKITAADASGILQMIELASDMHLIVDTFAETLDKGNTLNLPEGTPVKTVYAEAILTFIRSLPPPHSQLIAAWCQRTRKFAEAELEKEKARKSQ